MWLRTPLWWILLTTPWFIRCLVSESLLIYPRGH